MSKPGKEADPRVQLARAVARMKAAAADVERLAAIVAAGCQDPIAPSGKHAVVLEELRAQGCSQTVLRHYLLPVSVIVRQQDPRQLFREICTQLAPYPEHALVMAAERTLAERTSLSSPKQALDDVMAIVPRASIKITPKSHPSQWVAWMAHYATTDKGKARFYEGQQQMFELTEYPPGHWQNAA